MIAGVPLVLSDRAAMVLRLIAGAERVGLDEALSRAVVHYGEHVVGLQGLADAAGRHDFQRGGEAASRRSPAAHHNRESAGAIPAPATSHTPESDRGGGGNPAAPAGGCGPP